MESDNIYVAINIGSDTITAMAAQKNDEGQLRILGVESDRSQGVKYGEINNPSAASWVINNLLQLLRNRITREIGKVYVGLNGRSLKTLRANNGRELEKNQEVSEEMLSEMQREIREEKTEQGEIYAVFAQEVKIDDETEESPVGCIGSKVTVNYRVILGKPELMSNISRCLDRTGYLLADAPIQIVSTANAVLTPNEKDVGCALIDFGASCSTLAIFHHGYMRYLASIPMGGHTITKDIASLDIPLRTAEKVKIECANALASTVTTPQRILLQSDIQGIESKYIASQTLAYVTEARAAEIVNALWMYIEKSGLSSLLGAGIVLTGNGSKLKNLDKLINELTGLPVRTGSHHRHLEDGTAELFYDIEYSPLVGMLLNANIDCQYHHEEPSPKVKRPPFGGILTDKLTNMFEGVFNAEKEYSTHT